MPIIIGPEGPKTAKIALIGEAGGAQEERESRPFVGPAGALLNRLLSNAGILRSDCYITNVVKEHPPGNDITPFVDLTKKVVVESDAYRVYRDQLKTELESTDANILVAFGNVPLYTLTGIHPAKVTKRRGSIYESTLVPGRKVLACIHPSACLHQGRQGGNYIWQYFILHDLKRAMRESNDRTIRRMPFEYYLAPSFSEAETFLRCAKSLDGTTVAFDIEVVNLEVSCISIAADGRSMSIPFTESGHEYFTLDQETVIWQLIGELLWNPNIKKVGQNLVFDTQFLFRKYGLLTNNIDDTMIAQGILCPDFPKGLDFITSIYTDEPYYKDEGKMYLKIGGNDRDFWFYNAKDSAVCLNACPKILGEVKTLGNEETYEAQRKLVPILVYMSERGFRMDVAGLKKESERVAARILELGEALNRMAGREINPASPKQLADYLYTEKGIKPYVDRKTGSVTTDEDALKRLARKGVPEASTLLEIRRLSKLKGTYLDVQLDSDGRLRCSFNPVGGADSGRLSSSKTIWGTGMNLQNDPPEFKQFMLADEGYVLYNIDLEQAENRIVAYIAPEYKMIEAFETGKDVHSLTGALISGLPPEEVKRQHDEGINCPLGQGVYSWRFWGKKANHGLNYGLGYRTFGFYYEISESDANFIVTRYHQAYPGVHDYHRWVEEELRQGRRIKNSFGRTRLFMERWGDELFKEAYSFIPQSTVADIINRRGLLEVYYDQDKYHDVELLNQVHDSIVFQTPISIGWRAHATILLSIRKSLETPIVWRGREFVIPAGLDVGPTMTQRADVMWSSDVDEMARRLEEAWQKAGSLRTG